VSGARIVTILISVATGTCSALLVGFSVRETVHPVRRFHSFSIVIAVLAICVTYFALRSATARDTDEETMLASLRRGMITSFLALVLVIVLLFAFGDQTRGFLAHALGEPTSSFTTIRLLVVSVILGFGTGFVLRTPARPAE
jgi:cbb3-type cytochrome oxidase subunit 3